MFVIGITGGIGCGKSLAAKTCLEYGMSLIDADEISKKVTISGGSAIPEITEVFGKNMIQNDGSLNRKAMSDLVFRNKKNLDKLSAIVHKYVTMEIKEEILKLSEKKTKAVALDVPIPVKNGFIDVSDQIWVIWADEDIRLKRLNDRGMSSDEARRRMRCQMTKEEYEKIADIVITNNGTVDEFKEKIKNILDRELGARGIKYK